MTLKFEFPKHLIDAEFERQSELMIKSVQEIGRIYQEFVESVLRSLMPPEIRGDLEKCKEWIIKNNGIILSGGLISDEDEAVMINGKVIGVIRKTFRITDKPEIKIEWIDLRK